MASSYTCSDTNCTLLKGLDSGCWLINVASMAGLHYSAVAGVHDNDVYQATCLTETVIMVDTLVVH